MFMRWIGFAWMLAGMPLLAAAENMVVAPVGVAHIALVEKSARPAEK